MTLDTFIQSHNGKARDYDGVYGAQCVDLIKYYLRDCYGMKPGAWGDARKYFEAPNPAILDKFNKITNNPRDLKQIPKRGDIIIWSGATPGSGGAGHIAIFDGRVGPGVFRSFDQNWGGMYCHYVTHNWDHVLGWLTPKPAPAPLPQGGTELANRTQVNTLYKAILFRNGDEAGLKNYTGRDANLIASEMLSSQERKNLENKFNSQNKQLSNMQAAINKLNTTVASVTADRNAKKADLEKALATVAENVAKLESAHDTIQDLQAEKAADMETGNRVLRWLGSLFNKQ